MDQTLLLSNQDVSESQDDSFLCSTSNNDENKESHSASITSNLAHFKGETKRDTEDFISEQEASQIDR